MNLNQVTVLVSNLKRSIEFYKELGLKLIAEAAPGYARFECNKGNSTFSLHRVDKPIANSGTWIYFEIEELDTFVQKLLGRGILFEELPTDKSWLWREARLRDPDNNVLILYFAGENRLNPPWKLNSE